MTSFIKFINGSKAYLMIKSFEVLKKSKISCLDQNYTLANLTEKEVEFVKKKFLVSKLESLKFFVINNKRNSTVECYNLLTKYIDTVNIKEKCPDDYEPKSQTLCEKHILDIYNNTSIDSYQTTQIIHTSNNTMIIFVLIIIAAVVILIILTLCFFKKRRNNNNSNEVS